MLFGLVPALATTRAALSRVLNAAGRGSIGASGTGPRKLLVMCEMALAVMLLIGAGLLIRSYQRLRAVNPGFSSDRVLTFHVALPEAKYTTAADVRALVTSLVDRLGAAPAVESVAAVFGLPLDSDFSASSSFTRQGEEDSANSPSAGMRIVVIVNEEAARRFWPNQNPIGQQIEGRIVCTSTL